MTPESPRSALVERLRGWLDEGKPAWFRLDPLPPSFSWTVIFLVRIAIAFGFLSWFVLSDQTRDLIKASILVPIVALVVIGNSLGGVVLASVGVILSGAIGLAYNLAVNAIAPPSLAWSLCSTALFIFVICYLDINVGIKRLGMAAVVMAQLQRWEPGKDIDTTFVLDVFYGICFGAAVAIAVSLLPFPVIATSTREVGQRLRLLAAINRTQLAALTVAFTHETAANDASPLTKEDKKGDEGLRQRKSSAAVALTPGRQEEDEEAEAARRPHRYPSLPASSQRVPLLRGEVDDLSSLAQLHLAMLKRALGEMGLEPSLLFGICKVAATPGLPRWGERLRAWARTHERMRALLASLIAAERETLASPLHSRFLTELKQPLCALVSDVLNLYHLGLSWSARMRWPSSCAPCCASCAGKNSCLQVYPSGSSAGSNEGPKPSCTCNAWAAPIPCGYPTETVPSRDDIIAAKKAVEESLDRFFAAFGRTRGAIFYSESTPFRAREEDGFYTNLDFDAAALFPLASFLFLTMRFAQTVVSTVDTACALPPSSPPQQTAVQISASSGSGSARVLLVPPSPGGPAAAPQPKQQPQPSAANPANPAPRPTIGAKAKACLCCFARFYGLTPDFNRFSAAARITVASILSYYLGNLIHGYLFPDLNSFSYWGPLVIIMIAGGSRVPPTYSLLAQRMQGTVYGVIAALMIVTFSNGNRLTGGILLTLWVTFITAYRTKGPGSYYWSSVSAFTAAIIAFAALNSNAVVGAFLIENRTLFTIFGLIVWIVIAALLFPVTARTLSHSSSLAAVNGTRAVLKRTMLQWSRFIRVKADAIAATGAGGGALALSETDAKLFAFSPSKDLDTVEALLPAWADLLNEALIEPSFTQKAFSLLKPRYEEMKDEIGKICLNLRLVHQVFRSLEAEAKAAPRATPQATATVKATATVQANPQSPVSLASPASMPAATPSSPSSAAAGAECGADKSDEGVEMTAAAVEVVVSEESSAAKVASVPVSAAASTAGVGERGILLFSSLLPQLEAVIASLNGVLRHVAVISSNHDELKAMIADEVAAGLLPAPALPSAGTPASTPAAESATSAELGPVAGAALGTAGTPSSSPLQAQRHPADRFFRRCCRRFLLCWCSQSLEELPFAVDDDDEEGQNGRYRVEELRRASMAALPESVDKLHGDLLEFNRGWDVFSKNHIIAVYEREGQLKAGKVPTADIDRATAAAEAGTGSHKGEPGEGEARAEDFSSVTLITALASSAPALPIPKDKERQMLALSDVDALCLNTASAALNAIVRSVSNVASSARRLRHAKEQNWGGY